MARYTPDESTFATLAGTHGIVPVYRQLLADHLTPVTAFELLGGEESHAFLLESVVGGVKVGRYSFIATRPSFVYTATKGTATYQKLGHPSYTAPTQDPLSDLMYTYGRHGFARFARVPGLPDFTGGLVGYAGYDTARYYEPDKIANAPADDRGLPDVCFGLYTELVIFDHVDKTVRVVANAMTDDRRSSAVGASYTNACQRIDAMVQRLKGTPKTKLGEVDPTAPLTMPFTPNQSREQFEAAVQKGIEYIKAGDIFQFVPSMRLRAESMADPFDVYRVLRLINPSPYMFYLKTPDCTLIGSSPEVLCSVQDGLVTTRPLAGTRRRGATEKEDQELEAELLADPKERAEHIMLVDLHRNDIGRVCEVGSVKIDAVMTVERYSHVMHISSNVTGRLAKDKTAFDALRVSLPVGTVSGAPKIRAMQIIDEVETTRRGPYGGAVGYFDFAGNTDTCIALRTIVWTPAGRGGAGGTFDVQAGAGVVADSVPNAEYQESMNKAMALLKSVQLATEGL
ncbi:MAG TPA: anthranilate synthase component I [Tepidisphaeraceae bacterium]|jgi:anthranilate synthase component 1